MEPVLPVLNSGVVSNAIVLAAKSALKVWLPTIRYVGRYAT